MADTGAITAARARATKLARPVARSSKVPDRHLFRRLGRPRRATGVRGRFRRGQGARRRSTPTCSGSRCARSAAPPSAMPRRRWSRCGPTAGSSRWSAAEATRKARSTARRRRGGSRDRRSSCSSIWPRCAPAGPPDSMIEDRPITIDGWSPANSDGVYRGADHAARGLRAVEQCRDRAPVGKRRQAERAARCARARHLDAAARTARASRSAPPASACSN